MSAGPVPISIPLRVMWWFSPKFDEFEVDEREVEDEEGEDEELRELGSGKESVFSKFRSFNKFENNSVGLRPIQNKKLDINTISIWIIRRWKSFPNTSAIHKI